MCEPDSGEGWKDSPAARIRHSEHVVSRKTDLDKMITSERNSKTCPRRDEEMQLQGTQECTVGREIVQSNPAIMLLELGVH